MTKKVHANITKQILIAMIAGIILGTLFNELPHNKFISEYIVGGVFDLGGKIFINILKMLVVPIVFVSLVCGTFSLDSSRKFGRLAVKTIVLYILTTMIAITLALFIAHLFGVGIGNDLTTTGKFDTKQIPSLKETFLNIFPSNPIAALASGNMLQIIVFSILLGIAITWSGKHGDQIKKLFRDLDIVIMNLMNMVLKVAPYGVFCLVTTMFARVGFDLIIQLGSYFVTVLFVLVLHLLLTYSFFLYYFGKLSPVQFFKSMMPAMLFAFSTSSSSASIPVVLNTVEKKLGVKESIAAFVIPLGATINMDGTAIMQGVATVFIANSYNMAIGLTGFLKVILTATLASIGTAGIPSVGLITLTMVLIQVGLPIEGIAIIIGVDRILDMTRTAVNVAGDSMVSTLVAKSENSIDEAIFYGRTNEQDNP
jgi:Na+/H+-dicarboxylate symporter